MGASHIVDARTRQIGADTLAEIVSAYINMDMVGRLADELVVSGRGSSDIWARGIERGNAVVGLPIRTSEDTYLPSDSMAFHAAGVPSLKLFTGAHEDDHKPSDTAEQLNCEGLADIARFVVLVARSLASGEDEPGLYGAGTAGADRWSQYEQRLFEDHRGPCGRRPDGRTALRSRQGGTAEQAGLEGGDNIDDDVRKLNGLVLGETVDTTGERDGEQRTMEITPQVRN